MVWLAVGQIFCFFILQFQCCFILHVYTGLLTGEDWRPGLQRGLWETDLRGIFPKICGVIWQEMMCLKSKMLDMRNIFMLKRSLNFFRDCMNHAVIMDISYGICMEFCGSRAEILDFLMPFC